MLKKRGPKSLAWQRLFICIVLKSLRCGCKTSVEGVLKTKGNSPTSKPGEENRDFFFPTTFNF